MSQLDSSSASAPRSVPVQKPKTNVYHVLLSISLLMMLIGCLMMYLEMRQVFGP